MENSNLDQFISDPASSVVVNLIPCTDELVILLAGMSKRMGMPDANLFSILKGTHAKLIYLRDHQKLYFYKGLPGFCEDFNGLVLKLKETISEQGVSRVTLVGNCMGGFIAIMLGVLLNAEVVHAFNSTSTIRLFDRIRIGDMKQSKVFWKHIIQLNLMHWASPSFLDLRKFLREHEDYSGQINLYVNTDHPASIIHAERLREFPQVCYHYDGFDKIDIIQSL